MIGTVPPLPMVILAFPIKKERETISHDLQLLFIDYSDFRT